MFHTLGDWITFILSPTDLHMLWNRLTKHKGVNLTDIGPNYTDGFIQITPEHKSSLENMWQLR